jgi:hypothetical protein
LALVGVVAVLEAVGGGDALGPQLGDFAQLLVELDLVRAMSSAVTIV